MSYAIIDPIIKQWASQNNLVLTFNYKDYDVRSVEVVDSKGERFQIWIEEPLNNGEIKIVAWDYRKRKVEFAADKFDLLQKLDKAFIAVKSWMSG